MPSDAVKSKQIKATLLGLLLLSVWMAGMLILLEKIATTETEPVATLSEHKITVEQQEDEPEVIMQREVLPDFAGIEQAKERKEAFFAYLLPRVQALNHAISEERELVKSVLRLINNGKSVPPKISASVIRLAEEYKVNNFSISPPKGFYTLLARLDVIPVSMVFAQAANESAWGTSRFAVEGNNLFGQWCYTEGCGIVPERRPDGANYEVEEYRSVEEAVENYFRNINTNPAYRELRRIRKKMRDLNKVLCGFHLVEGLEHYSSRGWDYILDLQAIIRGNQLIAYDS